MTIEAVSKTTPKKDSRGRAKSQLRIAIEQLPKGQCLEIRFTDEELAEKSIRKRANSANVMIIDISNQCEEVDRKLFTLRTAKGGFDVFRTA